MAFFNGKRHSSPSSHQLIGVLFPSVRKVPCKITLLCNPLNCHVISQPHSKNFVPWWSLCILCRVPRGVVDKISKQPLAMENHHQGVSPQTWFSNGLLTDFFRVLTTTQDNNGKMYISTVESQRYPISGVQWHPEVGLQTSHYSLVS
jgi:hypothetical protein